MDEDGFWAIVDAARARCDGDWTRVPEAVTAVLATLPPAEVADFAKVQDGLEWAAYREDVWAACVLINGGFGSDDLFLYFRNWLLVQGRAVWEAALADPDSLADVPAAIAVSALGDDFADCEDFLYVANEAWERITGDEEGLEAELERQGFEPRRDDPVEPAGDAITMTDRDQVFAVLPRLAAGGRFERAAALRQRR